MPLPRPHPESAAANRPKTAIRTTSRKGARAPQSIEKRVVRPLPDLAERLDLHIPKRVILPELIGMHGPLRVDIGKANAGPVIPAAIPLQQFERARRGGAIPLTLAHPKIRAVSGLIHRKNLTRLPSSMPCLHSIHDRVERRARFMGFKQR
jgi:hypothetical protein